MLVMTLLVKNEADIIKYNLDHHLSSGVDKVIVMDNNSSDGTRDILESYQKDLVSIIDQPSNSYYQSVWVTEMNKLAKRMGANYIINADADEFFYNTNNLKDEFLSDHYQGINVDVINIGLQYKDGKESFPKDNILTINKNFNGKGIRLKWPTTFMYKTQPYDCNVHQGNHMVDGATPIRNSIGTVIYHFPYRSKKQFIDKIKNGIKVLSNSNLPAGQGYHWIEMYNEYSSGRIDDYYKNHIAIDNSDNYPIFNLHKELGLIQ
jgi:glycosyltransferase involved in cell wall biosynthesis